MNFSGGNRGAFKMPSIPHSNAYVKIIEQPATKAKRFRYESESKSHRGGVIPGKNSSPDNKTFPAIQIINFIGPAVVVVSCVTKDKPYRYKSNYSFLKNIEKYWNPFICLQFCFVFNRAHPHRLMGKDGKANKGIYTFEMNDDSMTAALTDLTIQYVKRNDIGKSLNERAQAIVDPFNSMEIAMNHSNVTLLKFFELI